MAEWFVQIEGLFSIKINYLSEVPRSFPVGLIIFNIFVNWYKSGTALMGFVSVFQRGTFYTMCNWVRYRFWRFLRLVLARNKRKHFQFTHKHDLTFQNSALSVLIAEILLGKFASHILMLCLVSTHVWPQLLSPNSVWFQPCRNTLQC